MDQESRLTSKVKDGQGWVTQTRAESHQRSRAPLGGIHPSTETLHTGTPRSLHRSLTRANMFTTRIPVLASTAPQGYMGPVSPEIPIKLQPQDEDSNPIARHQEGKRDRNEEPEHEQGPPQPEHQPALRRSKRIKAMKDAAPPKVKAPAKSTGRKRAVRKK